MNNQARQQALFHWSRRTRFLAAAVAFGFHGVLLGALATMDHPNPERIAGRRLLIELDTTRERPNPRYLVASAPVQMRPVQLPEAPLAPAPVREPAASPAPRPTEPTAPDPSPPPDSDDLEKSLQAERADLLAQLNRTRAESMMASEQAVLRAMSGRARGLDARRGPKGTIREIKFDGWPQPVVDAIMAKYDLTVTRKALHEPDEQNYLSSAATAEGSRFYANQFSSPGVYEVFEISLDSVAHMSRLEEAEIKRRGLDLRRTKVTLVTFGIVKKDNGTHDLGIIEFEAIEIE